MTAPSFEGTSPLDVPDAGKPCETWYKVVGDLKDGIPLITLHGGPGTTHEYMAPFVDLYQKYGKTVILYDQIGCGNSTHLRDKAGDATFWTVDLFVHELDSLIDHLNLRTRGFDILGHSWGGILGSAYAAQKPEGLRRLVLANSPASIPLLLKAEDELVKLLPQSAQDAIAEGERTHDFLTEQYQAACLLFFQRHLCRLDPWPAEVQRTMQYTAEDPTVYQTMYGPPSLFSKGSLKDWEGWSTADKIEVETLLVNGQYDQITDSTVVPYFERINKVKWVQISNSSHMGFWEERDRYIEVVGDFLTMKDTTS
ncbi:proline-specific peptidase [Polyplosphaeria fusca]|uniref:Proline-specific peptidase n=1 Tax=Polyplosphaeria fusca TaxID=682080 RepID=A0A9P4QMT5_9PLEO|nr:proline-specific peptidase [Polyplosphaeria fusca]